MFEAEEDQQLSFGLSWEEDQKGAGAEHGEDAVADEQIEDDLEDSSERSKALRSYSPGQRIYLGGLEQGEPGKRGAIFIRWAKYTERWVSDLSEDQFQESLTVHYEIQKSEEVHYLETERQMNRYGKIRAVVIQSGRDKRRAAILTNASVEEVGADRIVEVMCRRRGEENVIKELLLKHMINYTCPPEKLHAGAIMPLQERNCTQILRMAAVARPRGDHGAAV